MKRAITGLLALTVAALWVPAAPAAERLKANHYLPPNHPIGIGYQKFADVAEEASGGALKVRVFSGGSLLGAKATLDGVKDGIADVGFVVMTYYPAQMPYGRLIDDLSMVGPDSHAASFAITELFMLHCEPCRAEFERFNQVYLTTTSTPPYVIISGGQELNSLEALEGKKLRAAGALWSRWATFLGATPVNVPSSDMYEGLSRGIIDATIYAVGGLKTHGLADVTKSVVMLPIGTFRSDAMFSFNQKRWAGLTAEQRQAVFRAAAEGVVATNMAYVKGDEEGLEVAEKQSVRVVEASPALREARERFVEQDVEQTVKRAREEYGLEDPATVVTKYRELYAKYEPLLAPIRKDAGAMVDVLWREVFAQLDPAAYGVP